VLRTTSIVAGLKEKYHPELLDWLTSDTGKEMLLNNPVIDQIFTWDERQQLGRYDLVIGLEDDLAVCQFVSGLRPKKIVGAYAQGDKVVYTPSGWFDMSAISKYGLAKANELKKKNKKTFQQHLAALLGIKVGPYMFDLTQEEIKSGRAYVKNLGISSKDKVFGINTGAGKRWQMKALSIEKTVELVKRLKKELGVVSLILGGHEETERNEIICRETGMPNGGLNSLRHFASIVDQCQLVVSSDSLAMHLAIALKKRLVVFFGPTSATEIDLYGLGKKIDAGLACLAYYKRECDLEQNCVTNLSSDELFKSVKREAAKL